MIVARLKLLIWKNVRLRLHTKVLSVVECLFPLLLFYLAGKLKESVPSIGQHVDPVPVDAVVYPPVDEAALYKSFNVKNFKDEFVYYTPHTDFTSKMMEQLQKTFPTAKFEALASEADLIVLFSEKKEKFVETYNVVVAVGVVFEGDVGRNGTDSIPDSISYKIRYAGNIPQLIPSSLYTKADGPHPEHTGKSHLDEWHTESIQEITGFLGLQLALDKAFITLKSDDKFPKFQLQAFPYPKYELKADDVNKYFAQALSTITVVSFSFLCISILLRVLEEKDSGVKELMKMMGLRNWMFWASWVIHTFMIYAITITGIVFIMFKKFDEAQILKYSDATLIWIIFMLFCLATVFFCFFLSTMMRGPAIGMIAGLFIWFGTFSYLFDAEKKFPYYAKRSLCLLPHMNMAYFFKSLSTLESLGMGAKWSNLGRSIDGNESFTVGFVLFMFLMDIALYACLAYYIDCVFPGKYGVGKPFLFMFNSVPYFKNPEQSPILARGSPKGDVGRYFEKTPENLQAGVKIQRLKKRFDSSVLAVNDVSFNIHKGEITVLLGHNGAGKTTVMSIITGMIEPTSGRIFFDNMDIQRDMDKIRERGLGLCPQHNLLFPRFNVMEHMLFFARLKGATNEDAKKESKSLLEMLNIWDKRDAMVKDLSGGMKRKLSLAIALVGKPKTLILDEPTSGMDVESRRQMWDLLLSMRGERTILLTTHQMEEADVLGDRIAIMDHGKVVCYGTGMFLKKIFGTGYQVTILKGEGGKDEEICRAIREQVPESQCTPGAAAATDRTELTFNLPTESSAKFVSLFKSLESKRGIVSIGVTCTTMEQVFLKVGEKFAKASGSSAKKLDSESKIPETVEKSALKRSRNQFMSFMAAHYHYTIRKKIMLAAFALPIILAWQSVLTMKGLYGVGEMINSGVRLSLSTYPDSQILLQNISGSDEKMTRVMEAFAEKQGTSVIYTRDANMSSDLLKRGEEDILKYRVQLLAGASLATDQHTILYNTIPYHTPYVAVNAYSNALLKSKLGAGKEASIDAQNVPYKFEGNAFSTCPMTQTELSVFSVLVILSWIMFYMALMQSLALLIPFALVQRANGVMHLQQMTRTSPIVYWCGHFVFDFILYMGMVTMSLAVIFASDRGNMFHAGDLGVLLLILAVFAISGILYSYLHCYVVETFGGAYALFACVNIVLSKQASDLIITSSVYAGKDMFDEANKGRQEWSFWVSLVWVLNVLTYVLPPYTLLRAFYSFFNVLVFNNHCSYCSDELQAKCLELQKGMVKHYFSSNESDTRLNLELYAMLGCAVLYAALLAIVHGNYGQRLVRLITLILYGSNVPPRNDTQVKQDEDVLSERDRVDAASTRRTREYIFIADHISKYFVQKFVKKFTAVDDVNFGVKPGECFGLLGVNGAGKSTTFKILTADILPTKGDASVNNIKLGQHRNEYLTKCGYCPQTDAIIPELTGREMLHLFGTTRGLEASIVPLHAKKWIDVLGLQDYADRACGSYSGGNKRKLCIAVALIGTPEVVFLDEPTSGVDPVSRKSLYSVMEYSKKSGQAVVLTSHSMDECESLCNRITIMVAGSMKCVGTVAYLKNRYAQGFTIVIKVNGSDDRMLNELKGAVKERFGHQYTYLKDEHKVMLQYQVTNTTLLWSQLFATMNALKNQFGDIVDDYTISDTTLEEVFMSFAKGNVVVVNSG